MTDKHPNEDKDDDDERVPLLSVPRHLRALYSILFTVQMAIGIAYLAWRESTQVTHDTFLQTAEAIFHGTLIVGGISVFTTGFIAEVRDMVLGTRDWIRKRERAKGREEGREEGRTEGEQNILQRLDPDTRRRIEAELKNESPKQD